MPTVGASSGPVRLSQVIPSQRDDWMTCGNWEWKRWKFPGFLLFFLDMVLLSWWIFWDFSCFLLYVYQSDLERRMVEIDVGLLVYRIFYNIYIRWLRMDKASYLNHVKAPLLCLEGIWENLQSRKKYFCRGRRPCWGDCKDGWVNGRGCGPYMRDRIIRILGGRNPYFLRHVRFFAFWCQSKFTMGNLIQKTKQHDLVPEISCSEFPW